MTVGVDDSSLSLQADSWTYSADRFLFLFSHFTFLFLISCVRQSWLWWAFQCTL